MMSIPAIAVDAQHDLLDIEVQQLNTGITVNLSKKYAGQTLLVVNTASYCGYTGQYEGLQALYEKYKASGFVVEASPRTTLVNKNRVARRQ